MNTFLNKLAALVILAIGVPICIVLFLLTSLLWIPVWAGAGASYVCEAFGCEPFQWVSTLSEFIFLCYGFSLIWLIGPIEVLSGEDLEGEM